MRLFRRTPGFVWGFPPNDSDDGMMITAMRESTELLCHCTLCRNH